MARPFSTAFTMEVKLSSVKTLSEDKNRQNIITKWIFWQIIVKHWKMVFSKSKFCQSLGPHTCGTEKPRTHLQPRHISAAPLATSVPCRPMATPIRASCSAGASLTPSPVLKVSKEERTQRSAQRERERVCTCRKLKLLEIVWTLAYWYCTLVPCYFWLEIKPRFQCGNMKQNLVPFVQWVAPSLISIRCVLSTSIHWYEKCILFSYSNRVSACVHCMCTAA